MPPIHASIVHAAESDSIAAVMAAIWEERCKPAFGARFVRFLSLSCVWICWQSLRKGWEGLNRLPRPSPRGGKSLATTQE
jgi:hypothetical protein